MPTNTPAPVAFILGAPRSGTTLLRVMLAGHPRLFSPPEMVIAPFADMAERAAHMKVRFWEKGGLRRALMELLRIDVERAKAEEARLADMTIPEVYAYLQSLCPDRMIVDKCPHLSAVPAAMDRLAQWFPEARYLWILRHPGSVLRSVQNMPMAEVMLQGYDDDRDIWYVANTNTKKFLDGVPRERWTTVKYEELVQDARAPMERACAALGVPFHEAVLDPYEGDRMREGPPGARAIGDPNMAGRGRIQPELATSWLEGFDARGVCADTHELARSLGYDLSELPPPPITKVSEGIDALFETARELERSISLPMDVDAVEGRRFLLRMLSASVDLFVEQGDADRPELHHAEGPTRKMFADCPDADYLRAPLRTGPGRVYVLEGRVPPGTLYTGVVLYGKGGRVGSWLPDEQMGIREDGSFEVRISTEPQEGTWLRADGDETAVILRQYFRDRGRERPLEARIRLATDVPPPPPLHARGVAAQLAGARKMLRATFTRTLDAYGMASKAALNRFVEIPGERLFPTPDNRYKVAWYRFGQDQVMFVRGKLPEARYFSLCLYNAWMESLDYRHHRVCLNHTQMRIGADGSFEVCLAHRSPGHPDWLDTTGHHAGYVLARALLPTGPLPELAIEVIYEKEWEARKTGRRD